MTLNDLVEAVGEELGIVGAGQTVSAEDNAMVKRRYERIRSTYSHRGYVHWSAADEIPDAAATGITKITAYHCARPFELQPDPVLLSEGERELALYRDRGYPIKPVQMVSM